MISLRNVWNVAERDIKMFMRYKFLLIMRALWFIAQIALFGVIVNHMFREEVQAAVGGSYFNYYVAGIIITMLYSTAVFIGYDIYEEADHGVVEYLLSVPISRKELVLGRSIGGGLRSFLYVGPMMLFVLYIIGVSNILQLLAALLSLFLFTFGASGFSITLAVSIKSSDRFDILMGALDALIVRLSTTLYPVAYMPTYYRNIATINPLTFAADLFRWGAGLESAFLTSPLSASLGIILFFSTFTLLGIFLHERILEGGGWH
ncbi:MAG: ABC transporter permease [Nitrososphaerota archaeon]|nr:ABC transporter permease [Candidatus Bathyarchaeota archaeon]MDW8022956.1 ABC transporter permease [Nitrososphaerota archaeon]